jgi:hypothetical protein
MNMPSHPDLQMTRELFCQYRVLGETKRVDPRRTGAAEGQINADPLSNLTRNPH